jgi:hypothetical protein
MKTIITEILDDSIRYFQKQSFAETGKGLTFKQWVDAIVPTLQILREAKARVKKAPKIAIERASTVFNIVDEKGDLNNILGTFVVIDEARLERELLIDSIKDEEVQKLLPFNTYVSLGRNYRHIANASAYDVTTDSHVIREGETLCKRGEGAGPYRVFNHADCPGCLVKGKAIIVNHLFSL